MSEHEAADRREREALDIELDAVLDGEIAECWERYRDWVGVWCFELVLIVMAGALTAWTALVGDFYAWGLAYLGLLVACLAAATVMGYRARRRWAAAVGLRPEALAE